MTVQHIQLLEQKVQQLYQVYHSQQDVKIFAKFDRTLFSENGQTISFYLKEIHQTLEKIKSLPSDDLNHYVFVTERLLAQCSALSKALKNKNKPFSVKIKPVGSRPVKNLSTALINCHHAND